MWKEGETARLEGGYKNTAYAPHLYTITPAGSLLQIPQLTFLFHPIPRYYLGREGTCGLLQRKAQERSQGQGKARAVGLLGIINLQHSLSIKPSHLYLN